MKEEDKDVWSNMKEEDKDTYQKVLRDDIESLFEDFEALTERKITGINLKRSDNTCEYCVEVVTKEFSTDKC